MARVKRIKEYRRKTGVWVRGHFRSKANDTILDNLKPPKRLKQVRRIKSL